MNIPMIAYTIGQLLKVEAALMVLPMAVGMLYGESPSAFYPVIALLLLCGFLVTVKKPKNTAIYAKEGFLIVGFSWIFMSAFGALPFMLAGEIPKFVDAFFETVSGFTTTGSSVLTNVEALSRGTMFWRSFTHWVGGMGVLVFVLAIQPKADAQTLYIMKAEVPGPTCGKLVARVRDTALILYAIYFVMTVILIVLLLFGGMDLYDASLHAFGTAGTGGFGLKSSSVAYYDSAYIDYVIGIFMALFGINFNLYYFLLLGDFASFFKSEELRWYLCIIFGATFLIALNILPQYGTLLESLRYAFFQVSSIITTTGYSTADFSLWPNLSQALLVIIMFIGAMAGSTGGGFKVSRLIILVKTTVKELHTLRSPRTVRTLKLEGKPLDKQTHAGVLAYLAAYVLIFAACCLVLSLDATDHVSNFTAVVACFNNIGPGLGVCGPAGSFDPFSDLSTWVLSFAMLAGRLELFPILMIFSPSTYRRK